MAATLTAPSSTGGFKARKRRKAAQRRLRMAVAVMVLLNLAVWAGVVAALRGVDVAALVPL
ncbi:hypothetical protein CFHF_22620 [Caulobacter flavus]|uniref:Uncharacterized protein n=1 Tax=Caulobacter flavus TaxID=1679497 RepID=A0A2N5CMS3_9CAUL|nr:hypothetical protein [Caulobacter flavus]AYV47053.1 hypothetical protein C1707_12730 [Caulobacter flavus]PLR07430.1 hypothetical protein CFHF_22620 [Caulobacter flavus]